MACTVNAEWLGALTGSDLQMGHNSICGTIPVGISALTALQSLSMESSCFFGTIPPSIGILRTLSYLDLGFQAGSGLNGTIPSTISTLTALRWETLPCVSVTARPCMIMLFRKTAFTARDPCPSF